MSKYKDATQLSVDDIEDGLLSLGGDIRLVADLLNTEVYQLSFRIKCEPKLLKLVADLKDLDIPELKRSGLSFELKEKVLKAAEIAHLKPREIEEITGVSMQLQKRWLSDDPWFRDQWAKIRESFGERILKIVHIQALSGDWKAALEVLRSEFPELGYVRNANKTAEVTVNLTHEGMLDALEQYNSSKSDPTCSST